jgi:hypothetical protein
VVASQLIHVSHNLAFLFTVMQTVIINYIILARNVTSALLALL